MKKNKKLLIAALLLIVYALLMAQETILNQVWCYKENGSVNLEIAVFGLRCSCFPVCPDHGFFIPCQRSRMVCKPIICIDQPIDTAWLVRDIHRNPFDVDPVKHIVLTGQINFHMNNLPDRFPGPVFLLTKFLPKPLNPNDSVFLRC